MKGLAADLVATGVTAVAVSPGSTNTAMLDATAELYGVSDPVIFADNQLRRRRSTPTRSPRRSPSAAPWTVPP